MDQQAILVSANYRKKLTESQDLTSSSASQLSLSPGSPLAKGEDGASLLSLRIPLRVQRVKNAFNPRRHAARSLHAIAMRMTSSHVGLMF